MTDQGALEIVTPSIDLGVIPEVIVAREKNFSTVARYYSTYGTALVVTRDGEVDGKVCVSAPRRIPGLLVIMNRACRAVGSLNAGDISGNTAEAPDIDIRPHIRKFYREDREPEFVVNRVPGTGLIIVKATLHYCC